MKKYSPIGNTVVFESATGVIVKIFTRPQTKARKNKPQAKWPVNCQVFWLSGPSKETVTEIYLPELERG